MHSTLEIVENVSATLWLIFIVAHIAFIEYFHLVRREFITINSEGWRGIAPASLLVMSILGAVTTAVVRILMFWI